MKPTIYAALVTALLAAGAWVGLRSGECRKARIVCDKTPTDAGTLVAVPHEEVVQVCGDKVPVGDPGIAGCKVVALGAVYSASPFADEVRTYPSEAQPEPDEGCACSDGDPTCEKLVMVPDPLVASKWVKAPKGPEVFNPGMWRGCRVKVACSIHESMVTGIGADNSRSYAAPPDCNGPGKKQPVVTGAAKALE